MVDGGPTSIAQTSYSPDNYLYITVTVCQPGTKTCVAIDHVLVSTATSGLRVLATAVTGIPLTPEPDPAKAGDTLAECVQLPQGTAWGNVVTAEVQIAGETASSVPVQVISTPSATPNMTTCANNGFIHGDTPSGVQELGANGVIGLGALAQDCTGTGCVSQYFTCETNADTGIVNCQSNVSAAPPVASQVTNPVTKFATDKNGVIITLPAVDPEKGAASGLAGKITFGIGTQSDNAYSGTAKALAVSTTTGAVTTTYTSQKAGSAPAQYTSWFDTGSDAYFFSDAGIPMCTQTGLTTFYCPAQPLNLQATVTGAGTPGSTATVPFTVVSAETLDATNNIVFSSIASTAPNGFGGTNGFIWGVPFFFGRTVYIAYPGASIAGSGGATLTGPFVAF